MNNQIRGRVRFLSSFIGYTYMYVLIIIKL